MESIDFLTLCYIIFLSGLFIFFLISFFTDPENNFFSNYDYYEYIIYRLNQLEFFTLYCMFWFIILFIMLYIKDPANSAFYNSDYYYWFIITLIR